MWKLNKDRYVTARWGSCRAANTASNDNARLTCALAVNDEDI